jgi:hypothetical protein
MFIDTQSIYSRTKVNINFNFIALSKPKPSAKTKMSLLGFEVPKLNWKIVDTGNVEIQLPDLSKLPKKLR